MLSVWRGALKTDKTFRREEFSSETPRTLPGSKPFLCHSRIDGVLGESFDTLIENYVTSDLGYRHFQFCCKE
jgi:hypothetical protein